MNKTNNQDNPEIEDPNAELCRDGYPHDYLIVWSDEAHDGTVFVKKRCTICGKVIETMI